MYSPKHFEIANSLELWNEYFNRIGVMSDEEFYSLTVADRIQLLEAAFGPETDE